MYGIKMVRIVIKTCTDGTKMVRMVLKTGKNGTKTCTYGNKMVRMALKMVRMKINWWGEVLHLCDLS